MIDMEIIEVAYETDQYGQFAFSTPRVSLMVLRTAGHPFANVTGDDWFFAVVWRGVTDPTLYAVSFYDSQYGEQVSLPQPLPIGETFTMTWAPGTITLLTAGEPIELGTVADVVLVRKYPETCDFFDDEEARNWQAYLPNSPTAAEATYTTDVDGVLCWNHPEEGRIPLRFPKGHGALGQRVTDLNPFTGAAPVEYTDEVRLYCKGVYALLEEGVPVTLDFAAGRLDITGAANTFWVWSARGFSTSTPFASGTSDTVCFPVGTEVHIVWWEGANDYPGWNQSYTVQHQVVTIVAGIQDVALADPVVIATDVFRGHVFKWMAEPLAGAPIYADVPGSGWQQVATTDANGYWQWDAEPPWPASFWVHDTTWGTYIMEAVGAQMWASVGIRPASGFYHYTEPGVDVGVGKVWTFENVSYLPRSVVVQRMDGAVVVDEWQAEPAPGGGWQTVEVIPAVKYEAEHTAVTPYTFRLVLDGTVAGAITVVDDTLKTVRDYAVSATIGGKVYGNLLHEKSRIPIAEGLEEARRMGLEHGEGDPTQRSLWLAAENDDQIYSASAVGRECPYCHGQALIEPGIGAVTGRARGWCALAHLDENCGAVPVAVDARLYFESFPANNVLSGHYHLTYGPFGRRRVLGKTATDPLTYWYRPDTYLETKDFLVCWLTQEAGLLWWVAQHRVMAVFVGGVFGTGATSATVLAYYEQTGDCGLRPKLYPMQDEWQAATYEVDLLHLDDTTQTVTVTVPASGRDPVFLLPLLFTEVEAHGWRSAGLVDAVTDVRKVSGGDNAFYVVVDPPAVFDAGIPIVSQARTPYVLPWDILAGKPNLHALLHLTGFTLLSDCGLFPEPGYVRIARGSDWRERMALSNNTEALWANLWANTSRVEWAQSDGSILTSTDLAGIQQGLGTLAPDSLGAYDPFCAVAWQRFLYVVVYAEGQHRLLRFEDFYPHAPLPHQPDIVIGAGEDAPASVCVDPHTYDLLAALPNAGGTDLYRSNDQGGTWTKLLTVAGLQYPVLVKRWPYTWLLGYNTGGYQGAEGSLVVQRYVVTETAVAEGSVVIVGPADEGRPAFVAADGMRPVFDWALHAFAPKVQEWTAAGATPGRAEYVSVDSGQTWELKEVHGA
jgi:hypothetical protein